MQTQEKLRFLSKYNFEGMIGFLLGRNHDKTKTLRRILCCAGKEYVLTHYSWEGDALVRAGLPSYVIQEEFHRYDGYWWRPKMTNGTALHCFLFHSLYLPMCPLYYFQRKWPSLIPRSVFILYLCSISLFGSLGAANAAFAIWWKK